MEILMEKQILDKDLAFPWNQYSTFGALYR